MHNYFFVFLLIFCDFPLCHKIFGIIDYSISLFGNFERPMEGIILVVQMHKIIFNILSIYPGELLWDIFCTFLRIFVFFTFLYFLRTIQLLLINFWQMLLVFSGGLTLLKESFQNISSSAGRHLKLFCRGSFWGTLLYSWKLFRFTLWTLYRCFLCYSDLPVKRISKHVSLC